VTAAVVVPPELPLEVVDPELELLLELVLDPKPELLVP
jgi:hypothetical protein